MCNCFTRKFLTGTLIFIFSLIGMATGVLAQDDFDGTIILGRPTLDSITLNIVFDSGQSDFYIEYGDTYKLAECCHWRSGIWVDPYVWQPAVTDLYLVVTELSRIPHAQWHIPLNK